MPPAARGARWHGAARAAVPRGPPGSGVREAGSTTMQ
eukprot:CAMPEP_0168360070 /NCGR_PEP_ID=MMETSP0228-20121227/1968_1 /TAXON_ID=133427 /ORGANISM="Protoceratium reticulatum, Strain CCCM 535 (=CCMP 1889)" /LENGTH=36 /DNA_ID= /DNA_START= /DNA_END= /DNA_ORIENTATION=